MFGGCLVMIRYRKMSIDLGKVSMLMIDLLAFWYVYVDCFRKSVTFHISGKVGFRGKTCD